VPVVLFNVRAARPYFASSCNMQEAESGIASVKRGRPKVEWLTEWDEILAELSPVYPADIWYRWSLDC
jgi:hypothetical protein